MSKQKQPKQASKYDEDLAIIISWLRINPKKLVQKYKEDLNECLKAVPTKTWQDLTLIARLLDEIPEVEEFVKTLPGLNENIYLKLVALNSKNFKIVPEKFLKQSFINKVVSQNIKSIHTLPTEYRTYDTLEHFYTVYSNQETVEIIEDLSSYKSSLSDEEVDMLENKFGVLSFAKGKISQEKIDAAIEKNAFNIYTIPDNQISEVCAVKAIEKNPEVVLCKKIKFTDRIKLTFLKMIASMDKFKASAILNRAMDSFVKMIQEYDKKVGIVKDWSFFSKETVREEQMLAVAT